MTGASPAADHVVVLTTTDGRTAAVGPVTHDEGITWVETHPETWSLDTYWYVVPIHPPTADGYEVLP